MRRREFIGLLGGAAAVLPIGARAQQDATGARIAKIGILWAVGTSERSPSIGTSERFPSKGVLVEALADLGYVEGKTIQLIQRFPDTTSDVRGLARELKGRRHRCRQCCRRRRSETVDEQRAYCRCLYG
jgi:putative tryptophan/tyrosine transport system substrate-binding protein